VCDFFRFFINFISLCVVYEKFIYTLYVHLGTTEFLLDDKMKRCFKKIESTEFGHPYYF
jgi:hypothetical protein